MKEKVYAFLKTIPKGKVVTYGQIAAHFVFGGGEAQRKLLEQEGIVFESDGGVDLRKYGI